MSLTQPFLLVRTGQRFARLKEVINVPLVPGDTVKVFPGTYSISSPDTSIGSISNLVGGLHVGIPVDNITIEWEFPGQPAIIDQNAWGVAVAGNGNDTHGFVMGINCNNLTIRGIHVRGYREALSSGVYILSGYGNPTPPNAKLIVEYCKFYEFSNGILTRPHFGFSLYSRYNVYQDNGAGDGLTHGVYISDNAHSSFIGDTFLNTANAKPQPGMGHLIKTRAKQSIVKGCYFDPQFFNPNGGAATCMDFANGGRVVVVGNVIHRYGAVLFADDNPTIKYGEEQVPFYNANSPSFGNNTDNYAHDGRIHRLVVAQNTFRIAQPEGGPPFQVVQIATPTDEQDQPMVVTKTIEDNMVGSDNAIASNFVATYPSNTAVAYAAISNDGTCGTQVAGSSTRRASYRYSGHNKPPFGRHDTYRGGVKVVPSGALPTWIPATAWQWTDIPNTQYTAHMKNDGTGIAPVPPGEVTGGTISTTNNYNKMSSFGGPAYSRKNHELWLFGGGHAATTLNALCRWNLNKNTPDMTFINAATPQATKQSIWNQAAYDASGGYWPDGKPISPHCYMNNFYFDEIDEFGVLSLSNVCHPSVDVTVFGVVPGYARNGSAWRAAGYWANMPFTNAQYDNGNAADSAVFMNWAGTELHYHNDKGGAQGWRKLTASTRAHTTYGSQPFNWNRFAKGAARHDQAQALIVGGNDPGGGYQCRLLNMTTGAHVAQTVIGFTAPTGNCHDVAWISSGGYWVVWYAFPEDDNINLTMNVLVKLEISGTNQLTATQLTPSGTAHISSGGYARGMYYDDFFDCLIFAGGVNENLKAIKIN